MVLRPSAALFADLTARAAVEASFDGGDQGLLNAFFGDGTRGHPARHALFGPAPLGPAAADGQDDKGPEEEEEDDEALSPLRRPVAKDRRSDSGVDLPETTTSDTERNWFRLSFTYNMEMHRV